ncbi:aldose 1-epimerase [Ilumatobacter sp.]|uniref:aldose 1-epimerase n=1 Tax=Ilumatobacter sp. TaxID=1967498 RepID=UPI003B521F19
MTEPAEHDDLVLRSQGPATSAMVRVAVSRGGRLSRIAVTRAGSTVDLLVPEPDGASATSSAWGSFPMAPWAGRIRHGRFSFLGRDVALRRNHDDSGGSGGGAIDPPLPPPDGGGGRLDGAEARRHAIHGTTFTRAWTVEEATASSCVISCGLTGALDWPFEGVVRQRIEVHPDRLDAHMEVRAARGSPMPASIGWHPWFAKPDRLEFDPIAMYALDAHGIPTGELVPPASGPRDDCYVHHGPVRLHVDRAVARVVTVTSDTDHWVVYDLPSDATCVEPQTGPPDAANLRPVVVSDERPLGISMSIAWAS